MKRVLATIFLCLLLPSFAFAANCSSLTSGIQAYWEMSGNSNDATGNGNNGSDTSITYSTPNGKIGEGAGFGGSSNILVTSNNGLNITGALSVGMWINTTNSSTYQVIVGQGNLQTLAAEQYALYMHTNGNVIFDLSSGSSEIGVIAGGTYNDGVWHFIVGTYVPSTSGTIYVDGTQQQQITTSVPSSLPSHTGTSFGIGVEATHPSTGLFNGAEDEGFVMNCTLTQAQITTLYDAGAGLQYPFASNPVSAAYFSSFWW